jgi:hypothetical protein
MSFYINETSNAVVSAYPRRKTKQTSKQSRYKIMPCNKVPEIRQRREGRRDKS